MLRAIWPWLSWLATEPGWIGRCTIMGATIEAIGFNFAQMAVAAIAMGILDTLLFPKE